MLIGYFAEYKGYKGTIEFDPLNGYHGTVLLPHSEHLEYGGFQRAEDMYWTFKKCIDEYLKEGE